MTTQTYKQIHKPQPKTVYANFFPSSQNGSPEPQGIGSKNQKNLTTDQRKHRNKTQKRQDKGQSSGLKPLTEYKNA